MVTNEKVVQVSPEFHRHLKVIAVMTGERVGEVVERLAGPAVVAEYERLVPGRPDGSAGAPERGC